MLYTVTVCARWGKRGGVISGGRGCGYQVKGIKTVERK